MKLAIASFLTLFLSTFLVAQLVCAQQKSSPCDKMNDGLHIVATSELGAELTVKGARERITGRVSFHLLTSPTEIEKGRVLVRGFNIVFFGVSQKLIAGGAPVREPLGLLVFAAVTGKVQPLRYDIEKNQISG